jgi:vacuolar protein sorting-associated protein 45
VRRGASREEMLGVPQKGGAGPLAPMDPWAAARWYVVVKALGSVPGMKVMLLDSATAATVSLVCSQSQALEHQVYHVDKLGNPRARRLGGFRALVIVRPTPDNLRDLRQELADPKFDEYHLFFTNTLQDHHLQDIARADLCQVVRQVQELYLDFSPLGPDLFTLNLPSCMPLEPPGWDQPLFDSLCAGLTAVLLALKLNPVIAYQANSPPANKIALEVAERIATGNHSSDADLFRFGNTAAASKQPPLLLILDRRDDPVTALLSQWTYSAMVHEIMGMHHNRVTIKKGAGREGEQDEQVVLSTADDEFYRTSQHLVFGELGSALKSIVDEFQRSEAGAVSMAGGKSRLTRWVRSLASPRPV